MKKGLLIVTGLFLLFSCSGSGNKGKSNQNYFDRDVSTYSTGADGIDEKIVFHRSTKEYEYYLRAAIYNSSDWSLEDKGHYTESYDNDNIVTLRLDNAKIKGMEKLGTISTVKIDLAARTAELISITGRHKAKEMN